MSVSKMPLPALDLLAGVEVAWAAASVVLMLWLSMIAAVGEASRPACSACRHQQGALDRQPDAVRPGPPEIAVDRAPRRELSRQHAPWAAGAEQIQQRVQHFAQRRPRACYCRAGRPAAAARSARTPHRWRRLRSGQPCGDTDGERKQSTSNAATLRFLAIIISFWQNKNVTTR